MEQNVRHGRFFLRAGLLITALAILGSVQLLGTRAAQAQPAGLSALTTSVRGASVPEGATSADSSTIRHGNWSWMSILNNNSQADITNASVTYMSGYNPSLFDAVGSFPYVTNFGAMAPGDMQVAKLQPIGDGLPVDYTLGYDSTKTTDVSSIPAGGGQQTVTITVTPRDNRYVSEENVNVSFHLFVSADSSFPGTVVDSMTDPNNLDQGEDVQGTVEGEVAHWQLSFPQINKTYTFKATLNVPNDTGAPFDFQPGIYLDGQRHVSSIHDFVGHSLVIADPTLDGSTPGVGAVTFSADGSDHTWNGTYGDIYGIVYDGTQREQQPPLEVPIAVKPGTRQPVPLNPKSKGVVPVAILSTDTFNATTVDPVTVTFGSMGPVRAPSIRSILVDVNHDRKTDMLLFFRMQDAGLSCEVSSVGIRGQTVEGQQITGNNQVRMVGCKKL